jgi:fatty-acyl-CoA synthase
VPKALLAIDVQKGDRVAIWSPNRYEWVLVAICNCKDRCNTGEYKSCLPYFRISLCTWSVGVSVLISALAFKGSDYKTMIEESRSLCENLREVIFLDEDWEQFLNKANKTSDAQLETVESTIQFDDPVNIQYTSGTTGFPKGVTLSHYNLLNNGYFIGKRLGYTAEDKVCIPVPFYHCFGMVIGNLCCTSHGACMVIPSESFEPLKVLEAVEKERCTSLYGVPTMFIAELQLA